MADGRWYRAWLGRLATFAAPQCRGGISSKLTSGFRCCLTIQKGALDRCLKGASPKQRRHQAWPRQRLTARIVQPIPNFHCHETRMATTASRKSAVSKARPFYRRSASPGGSSSSVGGASPRCGLDLAVITLAVIIATSSVDSWRQSFNFGASLGEALLITRSQNRTRAPPSGR